MSARGFVVDDLTRGAQRRASDPRASAWVSANAGAGKTKVLTDRVVRLLLDGTPPARILCLTFTKAAAANMAIRVFERLGRWVTLDDAALTAELLELEGVPPDRAALRRARKLFARAVETPGGLKIETLHALCERLLHLVPFEANVPARFAVLDETQMAEATARALDAVVADAAAGRRPELQAALALAGAEVAGETLRAAITAAAADRRVSGEGGGCEALEAGLRLAFGLDADESAETLVARMLEGVAAMAGVAARLRTGKATDEAAADALEAALACTEPPERLTLYRAAFFTEKGEPRNAGRLVTKAVDPALKEALLAEQERLVALEERLRAARALERTCALFALALEVRARVERQKARVGALDFDDLIHKTVELLTRVESAWVLYKLDRGVDHVLVDEAQDTNPRQWEILRRITADFAAGAGARAVLRTRFAVGDPKQSIYGFQGAAPEEFETTRREWQRANLAADLAFEDVGLTLSFRSTAGVLAAVDGVFGVPAHFKGLSFGDEVRTAHQTARPGHLGHIELWPTVEPREEADPDAWTQPVDLPDAGAPALVAAARVARCIRRWTTQGDEDGRVWRPGDVLVLVRKRGPGFEAVIRELKGKGVPVAGQDRIDIAAHIAVSDLVAAGRAALLPQDDLTLASALKSPLAGLSDDDLVAIAADRGEAEPLCAALARHAAEGHPAAARGAAALALWTRLARAHGPFGFYAHLLGPHEARAALVDRLGGEAGDAIDVFLAAARAAEQGTDAPALLTFLARYEWRPGRAPGHTVRRDLDAARDEVRVMTVHGAKGLEAPVVFLLDGHGKAGLDPPLLSLPGDARPWPVWAGPAASDCAAMRLAREARREREREERNRLLYVALTRAADRLVVAPYRNGRATATETAWGEMIERALDPTGRLVAVETPEGPARVWREGSPVPVPSTAVPAPAPPEAVPAWLRTAPAAETAPAPPLSPSNAVTAADARPAPERREGRARARLSGILVHALLEHLPGLAPEQRETAARAFVAARAPALPPSARDAIVADARALIAAPELAPLFGPHGRAEVALAGTVTVGGTARAVEGRVDRLAVTPDAVILADFKTGAAPPKGAPAPPGHVRQIALYAAVLGALYPGRALTALLVYAAGPVVRALHAPDLAAALEEFSADQSSP